MCIAPPFGTPAIASPTEHGHQTSQNEQYVQCYNGICVVESKQNMEVLEHARQAAQKGQFVECYNGICVVADDKHPQAQNILGHMYEKGIGVQKNLTKAMQYYEKAAVGGVPDAECRLGHMYYQGTGGKKDPKKAAYWLSRAAKHNVAEAQHTLGHMYLTGDGVKKDVQAAEQWLQRAAANGVQEAVNAIAQVPPFKPFTKETPAGLAFEQGMGALESGWQGYGDIIQAIRKTQEEATQQQQYSPQQ
jgi:TPR repeat protein